MTARRIFITGDASGLGRALSERYARDGWNVLIGDVNESRGRETAAALPALGGEGRFLRCDVSRLADLEAARNWLESHWGGVDIVVNNAGVAVGGGITQVPLRDWEWILDINLLGVVRGCRVFTPLFQRLGGGRFVNIASMAGLVHAPMMSAYNAAKAAVVALSETLSLELARDNIQVSLVCPAFFRTNLAENLRAAGPEVEETTRRLVTKSRHSAEEIADIVFRGVAAGDYLILTHPEGEALWMMKRLLPYSAYSWFLARGTARMMSRTPKAGSSEEPG